MVGVSRGIGSIEVAMMSLSTKFCRDKLRVQALGSGGCQSLRAQAPPPVAPTVRSRFRLRPRARAALTVRMNNGVRVSISQMATIHSALKLIWSRFARALVESIYPTCFFSPIRDVGNRRQISHLRLGLLPWTSGEASRRRLDSAILPSSPTVAEPRNATARKSKSMGKVRA